MCNHQDGIPVDSPHCRSLLLQTTGIIVNLSVEHHVAPTPFRYIPPGFSVVVVIVLEALGGDAAVAAYFFRVAERNLAFKLATNPASI